MTYHCCDEQRREAVRKSAFNGIDFLEVNADQMTLRLRLFKPPATPLHAGNFHIEGGERITGIQIVDPVVPGGRPDELLVKADKAGDFSYYTLRLQDRGSRNPPPGYDPITSAVSFSFRVDCPTRFDCKTGDMCADVSKTDPPEIDYLSKDFTSFRQLMLNRMSLLAPSWTERNPADLQIALIELLAYVGDRMSYRQDAIATESYLGTARLRTSVRRHSELIDYPMHDGSNARVWVQVASSAETMTLPKGTQLLTQVPNTPAVIAPDSQTYREALVHSPEIFETLADATLHQGYETIPFHTYGNRECCLPKGATQAVLAGKWKYLRQGDILIFEELVGPETGNAADRDPEHRHAVMLTKVTFGSDLVLSQDVTEIEWGVEDALPFGLCLSARTSSTYIPQVSVAGGNILLADHGHTVGNEDLGVTPARSITVPPSHKEHCQTIQPRTLPARYSPVLKESPVTQRVPLGPRASAAMAMRWDPRQALPDIKLNSTPRGGTPSPDNDWQVRRNLIGAQPVERVFVAEEDNSERAQIRFGDGQFGMRPVEGSHFVATYRAGSGTRGNVGADSLAHIVSNDSGVGGVRNPKPAIGGLEPEPIEQVRQDGPAALRTQERAVTEADYAAIAQRDPEVQRASAVFRWTGSWHTLFLFVDRLGGLPVDRAFQEKVVTFLEPYRMAGQDLRVLPPVFVPLLLELRVCVNPAYFAENVEVALRQEFSAAVLPDGRRGFFHPDQFTFGQPVVLSEVYRTAMSVAGVDFVEVLALQRQRAPGAEAFDRGRLLLSPIEVAQLESSRNFPERGVLTLHMQGGR